MHTPSLTRRTVVLGVATVAVVLVLLDVFVYLSLRSRLYDAVDEILLGRAELATTLAESTPTEELVARLGAAGVPAVVRSSPDEPLQPPPHLVARDVALPGGALITVFASRESADDALEGVVVLEALGTTGAVLVAGLLLGRVSRATMRPLEDVAATARHIAAGDLRGRLRPDHPETDLGQVAATFDEVFDSLEHAVVDATTAQARSRRFLADAAHQLVTPISGIRVSAELLATETDQLEVDRLLRNLTAETDRVSRLLRSLLRIARLDQGEVAPFRRVPVAELVAICAAQVERATELAPALEVRLDVADGVAGAGVLDLDAVSMDEAVANLLDNARRHALRCVEVGVSTADGQVEVRVADDGPGMDADTASRAFDRFVTLDQRGGSGLGLPIARAIVEAHRGELIYSDNAFVLRVPIGTVSHRS